jgi:hypothetical protein
VPDLEPGAHQILLTLFALEAGGGMRMISQTPSCVVILPAASRP